MELDDLALARERPALATGEVLVRRGDALMPTYDPSEVEDREYRGLPEPEYGISRSQELHQDREPFGFPIVEARPRGRWTPAEMHMALTCRRHDHYHDTWRKDEVEELS